MEDVYGGIFTKVLSRIRPSVEEKKNAMKVYETIKEFIRNEYGIDAMLMGSVAKDTFLSNDRDLDIFIFFDPTVPREELEKRGLEIGRTVFERFGGRDVVVAYAEHPYIRGIVQTYEIEIVPAYRIKNTKAIKSAVDRTPFHTQYVQKKLKANDDVRLLKAFLKSFNAYGSDLKTEGFSGYLCELLVIHYGSFIEVLRASQNWKYQHIIDIEKHWKESEHKRLKRKFKKQPLIVIDPVDRNRNVAAALSLEKLSLFIFAARCFLGKPSLRFFERMKIKVDKKREIEKIIKQSRNVYALVFKKPDVIDDLLYPQLRRFQENMLAFLKRNEFVVEDSWIFGDVECGVALEILVDRLPDYRVIPGPRIFDSVKHQQRFLDKHDVIWFKNGRMVAEERRKYRTVSELIKHHLSGTEEEIRNKGVPRYIAENAAKGYSLLHNEQLKSIKSKEFWEGLVKFNIKNIQS